MKRFLLALCLLLLITVPVAAHGTDITYTVAGSDVMITALFDDGEPMAEAQVVVYAPNDPQAAYLRGEADADGLFTFTVDTSIAGSWDVTVRVASHGEIIRIPVTELGEIRPMDATPSGIPRNLLAVIVVAALGGIAFYFSRSGKDRPKKVPL